MKLDRHHHQHLATGTGLDQGTSPGLAYVARLGMQHLGERSASFDGDGDPLGKPRDHRQTGARGQLVERAGDRGAGADLREHASQLRGELTPRASYDPVERSHRALPRRHGQGQQLRDRRELLQDQPLALGDLGSQAVLA
jgi:hypothetical protein